MTIRIGVWNIDHPESAPNRNSAKSKRFAKVQSFLQHLDCDVYLVAEANAAIKLDGYHAEFSDESNFQRKGRILDAPNRYHQAAIYSKLALQRRSIEEPVNGILCQANSDGFDFLIYSCVMTIKDRFKKSSTKTYGDRVAEQIDILKSLSGQPLIAGGDFNLRTGWAANSSAYGQVKELAKANSWCWPTSGQNQTVQQFLHSREFQSRYSIEASVKTSKFPLSDHPFLMLELERTAQ